MYKFIVFALVCAALTQVRGDLEYEMKRALINLENKAKSVEQRTEGTIKGVMYKRNSLEIKANNFVQRESDLENNMKEKVQKTAEITEKKATEEKKPPATFECISKAEKAAIGKIEEFGPKFQVDIRRLEKTKLANIDVASNPLTTIKNSLPEKYEKYVNEIKSCKTSPDLRKTLGRSLRDYDLIFSELRRVEEQVGTYLSQFMRDGSNIVSNYSRQMSRIQGEGLGAIRRCMNVR